MSSTAIRARSLKNRESKKRKRNVGERHQSLVRTGVYFDVPAKRTAFSVVRVEKLAGSLCTEIVPPVGTEVEN